MYGSLDISVGGMIAQRTRLEAISANLANRDVILDSQGRLSPYRRKMVMLASGDPTARTEVGRALGVHVTGIQEDPTPPSWRYEPESPYAEKSGSHKGYVPAPNVNPVYEQIDALAASRAYEANVAAAEASKSMIAQALRLLA
ncbi:MAG: flagellar basal body rod protein FlgC [Phycisphaerae bacterium]|nr:flagellar basal body rod protein FlgC [Phycisphaerae bacterium]